MSVGSVSGIGHPYKPVNFYFKTRGCSCCTFAAYFLVIALIAAVFGFGGITAGAAEIAKIYALFLRSSPCLLLASIAAKMIDHQHYQRHLLISQFAFLTQETIMTTSAPTQQNTRQAVDGLANSADKAIDATRNYAHHALDAADEKIQALSNGVKPALEKLSRKAEQYAQQGRDMAVEAQDKARESLSNYSAATSRYVADKPVQSVLIAAAVGAAVAMLVSSARNRNRH